MLQRGRSVRRIICTNQQEGSRRALPSMGLVPEPIRVLSKECTQRDPSLRPTFDAIADRLASAETLYAISGLPTSRGGTGASDVESLRPIGRLRRGEGAASGAWCALGGGAWCGEGWRRRRRWRRGGRHAVAQPTRPDAASSQQDDDKRHDKRPEERVCGWTARVVGPGYTAHAEPWQSER